MMNKIYDSIIVGAGQSGLAMGYELTRLKRDFIILDGDTEVGGSWLRRWDSLKLFTPTEYNHLPGMSMNAPEGHYPDKYEVAQYLKDYVKEFDMEVVLNQMVFAIEKEDNIFRIECQEKVFYSQEVIMATGPFHIPFTPGFSKSIPENVTQLHSKEYRNIDQLQEGPVCVVGGGDSGVQIAKEFADAGREVYISSDTTSYKTLPQEFLGKTLWWWLKNTGLLSVNIKSKLGKYLSNKMQPVIGTDVKELFGRDNVTLVKRAESWDNAALQFQGGTSGKVNNIVWATGYRPDFSILKFDNLLLETGYPKQERGITEVDGLYFIGLPWMYTRGSATLGGVQKDSEYLKRHLENKKLNTFLSQQETVNTYKPQTELV